MYRINFIRKIRKSKSTFHKYFFQTNIFQYIQRSLRIRMKPVYIALLALLGQTLTAKVSYKNYKVYNIVPNNNEAVQALRDLEGQTSEFSRFKFWSGPTNVGREASIMVAPELQEDIENILGDLDATNAVMIEDVQERIDSENPSVRADDANPVNWLLYNTLDEINAWLEGLAVEFPNAITILKPGKSHHGRDIVGLRLDFTPSVSKQVVFMESNIHAREWITSAVNTYILDQFLRNTTNSIRELAEKYTWYFFPVMNPDGFAYTHESDRLWRKTRTRYSIFCYGADPNRNWGYQWMNGGASQNPCSEIYAGPHAFSEPSVEVMRQFIEGISGNMVAYLDFHSYSQMLLLPFGHTTEHLSNYDEMYQIAEVALNNLTAVYGTQYVFGNVAETIYIAAGSSMDWVKGAFNVPIAFTYELRDRGQFGFILPAEQILPTAEETLVSIISIFQEYEKLHPSSVARNFD